MYQAVIFCILLGIISAQAFTLTSGILNLRDRINAVNTTLEELLESVPASNISTNELYGIQKQNVRTLGAKTFALIQKKIVVAQATGKYIEPCFRKGKSRVNDAREKAYSSLKNCSDNQLKAEKYIRDEIEATFSAGAQLLNDLDQIEEKCAKGPKHLDAFCIAEKLPASIEIVTMYEATALKAEGNIRKSLGLSSKEELDRCFQKAKLILSEDLTSVENESQACFNSI